jgi:hypothetical protein
VLPISLSKRLRRKRNEKRRRKNQKSDYASFAISV